MTDETEQVRQGRPPHEPTQKDRNTAETMSGFGIPQADIARTIGIAIHTLTKHYEKELLDGITKANAAVAQSLYKKALANHTGSVTAAIFWAKTRMGWKDTTHLEHSGPNGGAIPMSLDVSVLSDATMAELLLAKQKSHGSGG